MRYHWYLYNLQTNVPSKLSLLGYQMCWQSLKPNILMRMVMYLTPEPTNLISIQVCSHYQKSTDHLWLHDISLKVCKGHCNKLHSIISIVSLKTWSQLRYAASITIFRHITPWLQHIWNDCSKYNSKCFSQTLVNL